MTHPDELIPANDEHDVLDLLIEAHRICTDALTKDYIKLALLHEGRKISDQMRQSDRSA